MKRKKEDRDTPEVGGYLVLGSQQHREGRQSAGQTSTGTAPTRKVTFTFIEVREKPATFEII